MRQHQILAAVLGLALVGCRPEQPAAPAAQAHVHQSLGASSPDVAPALAQLRRLTAPFHQFAAAQQAGWGTQLTECFSSPDGGMGFHYAKVPLIDGTVDAAQPELLMYEPQRDGSLRFVGVEYIVPRTAWTGTEPPVLYGQTFPFNAAFDLYGLHVRVGRDNLQGVFASWNLRVSCRYADRVVTR